MDNSRAVLLPPVYGSLPATQCPIYLYQSQADVDSNRCQ